MLQRSSPTCLAVCLSIALALPSASRNAIPAPAKAILERADRLEVLSLDPNLHGSFHGYRVLKTVLVTSPDTRKALVSAFEQAVKENQGEMAMCFNPRHGLRATNGEKQEEFVICFQCLQVEAYGETEAQFLVSRSAAPAFDEVLRLNEAQSPNK
jgi:hypothetical protein